MIHPLSCNNTSGCIYALCLWYLFDTSFNRLWLLVTVSKCMIHAHNNKFTVVSFIISLLCVFTYWEYIVLLLICRKMATLVEPPNRIKPKGKHYYTIWQTLFEIDTKYVPIKPIGRGAYGVVCSSINRETNEKVAIKKIGNIFENSIDALRTLRELKLLRHIRHENVIALKDVMMPIHKTSFKDVYLVYELMDTDLHQIIKSSQPLSNDHCKYFLFQVLTSLFWHFPFL